MPTEEEINKKEKKIKKENDEINNKINCNYDDLIKNILLQFNQYYKYYMVTCDKKSEKEYDNINNNNINKEAVNDMKIEDVLTKNFINKIYQKRNLMNNINNNDDIKEIKKTNDNNNIINEFIKINLNYF